MLLCFLWMLLAALENALYPEFGYDRSGAEPVERIDEYVVMGAYLASFLLVNLLYWLYVLLKMRGRDTALHRKYEAERQRRDDAAAALAEKKGRRSRTSASLA